MYFDINVSFSLHVLLISVHYINVRNLSQDEIFQTNDDTFENNIIELTH